MVLWSIDWPCTKSAPLKLESLRTEAFPKRTKRTLKRVLLSGIVPLTSWLVHKLLQQDTLELDMKSNCAKASQELLFHGRSSFRSLLWALCLQWLTWHATLIVGEAWQEDETLLPMEANERAFWQACHLQWCVMRDVLSLSLERPGSRTYSLFGSSWRLQSLRLALQRPSAKKRCLLSAVRTVFSMVNRQSSSVLDPRS